MRVDGMSGRWRLTKPSSRASATYPRVRAAVTAFVLLSFVAVLCSGQSPAQQSLEQFLREDLKNERIAEALRNNRPKDALLLLQPAAEAGDPLAQVLCAAILSEKLEDHEGALRWLRLAKASGEKKAYFALATMYKEGRGVERSPEEAYALLFVAAAQGDRDAQIQLAEMYLVGEVTGVPSVAECLYWVARASAAGDSRATQVIRVVEGELSKNCDEMRRSGLPAATLERFCVDWTAAEYAKPVQSGDCNASFLGATLRQQFRVAKGAAEGWAECSFQQGMKAYLLGRPRLAYEWLLRAALKKHPTAEQMLATMYSNGKASADTSGRTRERAEFWWAAAARAGDESAVTKVRELGIDVNAPKNVFARSRLLELGYDLTAMADGTAQAGPAHSVPAIVGTWRQSAFRDGEYRWLGTVEVIEQAGEYQMYPVAHSTVPGSVHSLGIHSISFDGKTWRFTSEWGDGYRGTFYLTKVSENRFEGFVWIGGTKGEANRWDRVR